MQIKNSIFADTGKSGSRLEMAQNYTQANLSVVAIRTDGSKAPVGGWKARQKKLPTSQEIEDDFGNGNQVGIGIVCGEVSGNSEILDFDEPALLEQWADRCREAGLCLPDFWVVKSPKGWHVYYRCPDGIEGNKKLAQRQNADGKLQTLIETRGEGGYVIAPGSPASCHPENKTYVTTNGSFDDIPTVTAQERQIMLDVAASFNEHFTEAFTPKESALADGTRPGDDFNNRANWKTDILLPAGCTEIASKGEETRWIKPGSTSKALHATLNYQNNNRLSVFSTSFFPGLEAGRSYTKFQTYTYFFHNGEFAKAAKTLAARKFGSNGAATQPSDRSPDGVGTEVDDDNSPEPMPIMDAKDFYGTAGEFALEATRESEADPVAVYTQFLAYFGIAAGRNKFFKIGFAHHHPRLFVVPVGKSAKARKGTSWEPNKAQFKRVKELGGDVPDWRPGPLSSGEGIVYAVRDPSEKLNPETKEPVDPGIKDKRLFISSSEFAAALRAMKREGNVLSTVLRALFDGDDIAPLIKNNPVKVTSPHIGIAAHITKEELLKELAEDEIFNGLGNRFLFPFVRRPKLVPFPKQIEESKFNKFAEKIKAALDFAQQPGEILFSDKVISIWPKIYNKLQEELPGIVGVLLSRGEVHVIRLSMIFALLDQSNLINEKHMRAALAIWNYCRQSVLYIFGGKRDDVGSRILSALERKPHSQTELNDLFSGHRGNELRQKLSELESGNKIERETIKTKGKNKTIWKLKKEEGLNNHAE